MKAIPAPFLAAMERGRCGLVLLATFDFGSDTVWRFWDGFRNFTAPDGREFIGAAAFGGYQGKTGGAGLAAVPRQFILDGTKWAEAVRGAGLDPGDPAAALREITDVAYRHAPVTLELLGYDIDTTDWLGTVILDQVRIDHASWIRDPAGTAGASIKLVLHAEGWAARYDRGTGRTFTHEDQMALTGGTDEFFKYQTASLERESLRGQPTSGAGGSVDTDRRGGPGSNRTPVFQR